MLGLFSETLLNRDMDICYMPKKQAITSQVKS